LFYAWGAPQFIFIVLASIIVDFYLVQKLNVSKVRKTKRWLLAASVVLNVGLLLYFKYANFFVENVNFVLTEFGLGAMPWLNIALPIGISFFTFQKLTYSVDVYRGIHKPLKKVSDYALYILMFPQLIAGPIVRFNEIADQIEDRKKFETSDNRLLGFFRFTIGLAKKVLIANVMGETVDAIFALSPETMSTSTVWIGIVAYAFQIYFDFAGYSDMAIGLGKMMGFTFPENFNNPYISRNISEFWRRWHITLGRWMKDYLYIPLGGNKVSTQRRLYFNLWLVFIISGLWHGAAWNFMLWGVFHGFFLILDRIFLIKALNKLGKHPSILITFIITLIGWVLFRSPDIAYAFSYIQKMFAFDFGTNTIYLNKQFLVIGVLAIVFSFFAVIKGIEKWQTSTYNTPKSFFAYTVVVLIGLVLLSICIGAITSTGFNPFIYFRF
jgi:alginate O-acetyltransferase complex protein AlgI